MQTQELNEIASLLMVLINVASAFIRSNRIAGAGSVRAFIPLKAFLTKEIENSCGVTLRVLTYKKQSYMVGKVVPHSDCTNILEDFAPMERLMSLADTPFFVRSSASRLENCSSYMSNHHPSIAVWEDSQNEWLNLQFFDWYESIACDRLDTRPSNSLRP